MAILQIRIGDDITSYQYNSLSEAQMEMKKLFTSLSNGAKRFDDNVYTVITDKVAFIISRYSKTIISIY